MIPQHISGGDKTAAWKGICQERTVRNHLTISGIFAWHSSPGPSTRSQIGCFSAPLDCTKWVRWKQNKTAWKVQNYLRTVQQIAKKKRRRESAEGTGEAEGLGAAPEGGKKKRKASTPCEGQCEKSSACSRSAAQVGNALAVADGDVFSGWC